jgi:dTDP-glucose 4,6-dehydratase
MRILVTGGAGFIGSALIRHLLHSDLGKITAVLNFDKLTYAGNLSNLKSVCDDPRYQFVQADIRDKIAVRSLLHQFQPDALCNLAAESHVDRSIDGPENFITTNIQGTYTLLQETLNYWQKLGTEERHKFRFLHISTDEVFGSLGPTGQFDENSRYQPNSPYSASKAASDHLVRAWYETYGLPTIITNCSNNYGPFHFPEKLIPLMIIKAMRRQDLPVYGTGENIRDWLYVEDHARALKLVLEKGEIGQTYNIGGNSEINNIDLVKIICDNIDNILNENQAPRRNLIKFVNDRPGHDLRYAMNISKISAKLGWYPQETLATGLIKTINWYLTHQEWWEKILEKTYAGERLGKDGSYKS